MGLVPGSLDNDRGTETLLAEALAGDPVMHPSRRRWVEGHAGFTHTCALDEDGEVYCWGFNEGGPISPTMPNVNIVEITPVELPGPVQELVAGARFNCARMMDNSVACWGSPNARCAGAAACDTVNTLSFP